MLICLFIYFIVFVVANVASDLIMHFTDLFELNRSNLHIQLFHNLSSSVYSLMIGHSLGLPLQIGVPLSL